MLVSACPPVLVKMFEPVCLEITARTFRSQEAASPPPASHREISLDLRPRPRRPLHGIKGFCNVIKCHNGLSRPRAPAGFPRRHNACCAGCENFDFGSLSLLVQGPTEQWRGRRWIGTAPVDRFVRRLGLISSEPLCCQWQRQWHPGNEP